MILKKKILHSLLGFTILLQAAFFQVAMPNLVLCIGDDGHVAFEWRSQNTSGRHKDSVIPNLFSHGKIAQPVAGKIDCTDINLHFHPSQAEKTHNKNVTKTILNVFYALEARNQEKINSSVSVKIIQPPPVNLNIGIDQSPVLII